MDMKYEVIQTQRGSGGCKHQIVTILKNNNYWRHGCLREDTNTNRIVVQTENGEIWNIGNKKNVILKSITAIWI